MIPCFESITRLRVGGWNIRVWRTEQQVGDVTNADLKQYAEDLTRRIVMDDLEVRRTTLVVDLSAMPDVSAVEVTDDAGEGCITYPTWP